MMLDTYMYIVLLFHLFHENQLALFEICSIYMILYLIFTSMEINNN